MASRNAYRDVRKQRNLVLDRGLDARLVVAARGARVSVNEFVVRLIEEVCGVGECDGSGVGGGVAASGGGAGAGGGRVGDGVVVGVSGGSGRSVDWAAILERGRRPVQRPVESVEPDPLDVIA